MACWKIPYRYDFPTITSIYKRSPIAIGYSRYSPMYPHAMSSIDPTSLRPRSTNWEDLPPSEPLSNGALVAEQNTSIQPHLDHVLAKLHSLSFCWDPLQSKGHFQSGSRAWRPARFATSQPVASSLWVLWNVIVSSNKSFCARASKAAVCHQFECRELQPTRVLRNSKVGPYLGDKCITQKVRSFQSVLGIPQVESAWTND